MISPPENEEPRRWFRCAQRKQSAHRFDAWLNSPEGQLTRDLRQRLLLDLVRPKWGESVLHVGCASGETMCMLADAGTHVAGIDSSTVELRETRHRLGAFWLAQGEAIALPFADESFDIAIVDGSLEFIEDPAAAVRELARVARKRIYVATINPWSLRAVALRLGARWQPPFYADARFYSLPRMLRLLTIAETVRWHWGAVPHVPGPLTGVDVAQRLARAAVAWPNPFAAYLGFVADVVRLAPARVRAEPPVRVVSSAEAAIARVAVRRVRFPRRPADAA
jgi:ubiquinone/menaquinone biosynthesis C-methylase UbiE